MTYLAALDHAERDTGRFLALGRFMTVVLLFTISTNALVQFGWQYDGTGGGPLDKLHPATWLAVLLLGLKLCLEGNPLTATIKLLEKYSDLLPYLLGIIFMVVYATAVIGSPFTIFIETFLGPLVIFLLFANIGERDGQRLAQLIHLLLLINALLGIYEFVFSYRLFPLVVNGEELTDELRSTALLGHPLANAAIVGCYLLILTLGGRKDLGTFTGLTVFTVNAASVIVFGGRAATILVIVALAIVAIRRLFGILKGAPIRLHTIRLALIAVPLYSIFIVAMAELGFFDMFLSRFGDDEGSASTRIIMFSLFEHMDWFDLIFVPDSAQIATWSNIYGLNYGIENFVVAFILAYGLLATVIFLPTLSLFCRAVSRHLRPNARWVFLYFFAVSLTSVSLSAKSPLLSLLIVMLMVLMRRNTTADERYGAAA